ncbi:glycoside hydrolase family 16 protein [Ophiostoma piceae UAMH 11346]|uniref:Glycoside hydrolase family 16 protein n=1 Tax=Ophiostoma piceae (strain UAMH 11346) TaxID=1262450 RepID=S3CUQ6_OPHP1|nr:glycoside hydrolase family 16 protein [Ophiostoma piceae UAMH 11346]
MLFLLLYISLHYHHLFSSIMVSYLVLCLAVQAAFVAAQYELRRTYNASNFAEKFRFVETALENDPTGGFVNYVSHATAVSKGLFRVLDGTSDQGEDQIFIGVDNSTVLPSTSTGRDSLRLEALETIDVGLLIADIAHMPGNQCGIWPAFWTYNFQEDPISEIDIIEGVGFQVDNTISLHTCDTCRFSASTDTTGTDLRTNCGLGGNCASTLNNGAGCGVTSPVNTASFGDEFNAVGGGVYALQLEPGDGTDGILKIWNFERDSIPFDITDGTPDPSSWGRPVVSFEQQNGGCEIGRIFHGQTLIINIEVCGEAFTDAVWQGDEVCNKYSSCPSFISDNPEKLSDVYWLFNSIKLYS